MLEVKEQCKNCFHFQVCANVLKSQLLIRENMLSEENPKCEHFIPAADVVEERHGEWEITKKVLHSSNPYMGDDKYVRVNCSECDCCIQETRGGYGWPKIITSNYCPDCGAKMRRKDEESE